MTAAPEMRDLAHRLLTYEAVAGKASESKEAATLRVYEKLRQSLSEIAGVTGFQSLASRALAQARPEAPSLSAARVAADGSLQGLGEFGPQIDIDKDRVRATEKKYAKQQAKRAEKSLAYHNEKLKQFEAKVEAAKRKKATEA